MPPLLRAEPALAAVLGRRDAVLAVAEPARAITLAALAHLSDRRPVLVAVPTSGEAERLAADLAQYVGGGPGELSPAWEPLPFERGSPAVETMGRRLRTMWRLRAHDAPQIVVA